MTGKSARFIGSPWLYKGLGALGGGVGMVLLGQALAVAGGSCAILCRPPIAAIYGAVLGFLMVGNAGKR